MRKSSSVYSSILVLTVTLSSAFAQDPGAPEWTVEKVRGGFQFVEGPVWRRNIGLLFSDIPANTIYRWTDKESLSVYLHPSDSSNGLTYDRAGRLVLTQMKKRRIARRESDGTIVPIVSSLAGKKFNCPNDLVFGPDSSLFFTDPDFNIPKDEKAEMPTKGVYRLRPNGTLDLVDGSLDKPNGICFSPDGKRLYVNDSRACLVYVWDMLPDGSLGSRQLFYTIPARGYADGMKTDSAGNLYCTGPGGVWVISPHGTLLTKIELPESPTNCAWGDEGGSVLYITATTGLYRATRTR